MANHTIGKLRVEVPPSSSGFGRAIYAERETGPDIFVAYVGNWKQPPETENADAQLFASSPLLLEALKAVLPYALSRIQDMNETPDEHADKATLAYMAALRAIENAEGPANG